MPQTDALDPGDPAPASRMPHDAVLFLVGSTAAGKKEIGLRVAEHLGAEVLFMDSVKVFRGLRVGAAAPSPEDLARVPAHLLEVCDPDQPFSLGRYLELATAAVAEVRARGGVPLFLGGTPLYLQGLVRGFFSGPPADPELRTKLDHVAAEEGTAALHRRLVTVDPDAARRIDRRDRKRLIRALEVFELTGRPISALQREETRPAIRGDARLVGLRWPPDELRRRQATRVDRMLDAGLVEEVRGLVEGGRLSGEAARSIGYRETLEHLQGHLSANQLRAQILADTRQLDRKQQKWLRRFSGIRWIDRRPGQDERDVVAAVLRAFEAPGEAIDDGAARSWLRDDEPA